MSRTAIDCDIDGSARRRVRPQPRLGRHDGPAHRLRAVGGGRRPGARRRLSRSGGRQLLAAHVRPRAAAPDARRRRAPAHQHAARARVVGGRAHGVSGAIREGPPPHARRRRHHPGPRGRNARALRGVRLRPRGRPPADVPAAAGAACPGRDARRRRGRRRDAEAARARARRPAARLARRGRAG